MLEKHYANERIRQEQQGLGKPIISARLNDYQIVAVGNTIHWSNKAKTFADFLGDYIKRILGEAWGNAELAKPVEERHPLLQWYGDYCGYQALTIKTPGEVRSAVITGVVACYIGTAYSLYLLAHNVELQARLVRRLKNRREFQGAYYELIIANTLIRAGFKLTLEDEADTTTKHCEFAAVSQRTGKKYWVEAKMRGVAGLLGKDRADGTTDTNPISHMIPQLNNALQKPAMDERLIFIDLNAEPTMNVHGQPTWAQTAMARLERFETNELKAGMTAYIFVTNISCHRYLSEPPQIAAAAFGLGIPDFSKPGYHRLSEMYRRKRKHIDAHEIAEVFTKYPQIPATFDGSLASEAFGGKSRVKIGETYAFEGLQSRDSSIEGGLVATVTAATVSETEKLVYIAVTDQDGNAMLLTEPMSSEQIDEYKAHPQSYFGVVQHVGGSSKTPYELFEFFLEANKLLTREVLLERLAKGSDVAELQAMNNSDLLVEYCEQIVIATGMLRDQQRPV